MGVHCPGRPGSSHGAGPVCGPSVERAPLPVMLALALGSGRGRGLLSQAVRSSVPAAQGRNRVSAWPWGAVPPARAHSSRSG